MQNYKSVVWFGLACVPICAIAGGCSKPTTDPRVVKIVDAVHAKLQSIQSFTATTETLGLVQSGTSIRHIYSKSVISEMKPNYYRWVYYDLRNKRPQQPTSVEVSDGQTDWTVRKTDPTHFTKRKVPAVGMAGPDYGDILFSAFFQPKASAITISDPSIQSAKYDGTITWRGGHYRVIEVDYNGSQQAIDKYYIGDDDLLHRLVITYKNTNSGKSGMGDHYITSLNLNPKLTSADFVFKPPKGAIEK